MGCPTLIALIRSHNNLPADGYTLAEMDAAFREVDDLSAAIDALNPSGPPVHPVHKTALLSVDELNNFVALTKTKYPDLYSNDLVYRAIAHTSGEANENQSVRLAENLASAVMHEADKEAVIKRAYRWTTEFLGDAPAASPVARLSVKEKAKMIGVKPDELGRIAARWRAASQANHEELMQALYAVVIYDPNRAIERVGALAPQVSLKESVRCMTPPQLKEHIEAARRVHYVEKYDAFVELVDRVQTWQKSDYLEAIPRISSAAILGTDMGGTSLIKFCDKVRQSAGRYNLTHGELEEIQAALFSDVALNRHLSKPEKQAFESILARSWGKSSVERDTAERVIAEGGATQEPRQMIQAQPRALVPLPASGSALSQAGSSSSSSKTPLGLARQKPLVPAHEGWVPFKANLKKAEETWLQRRKLKAYSDLLASTHDWPFKDYLAALTEIGKSVSLHGGLKNKEKDQTRISFLSEMYTETRKRKLSWEEAADLRLEFERMKSSLRMDSDALVDRYVSDWIVAPPIRSIEDVGQRLSKVNGNGLEVKKIYFDELLRDIAPLEGPLKLQAVLKVVDEFKSLESISPSHDLIYLIGSLPKEHYFTALSRALSAFESRSSTFLFNVSPIFGVIREQVMAKGASPEQISDLKERMTDAFLKRSVVLAEDHYARLVLDLPWEVESVSVGSSLVAVRPAASAQDREPARSMAAIVTLSNRTSQKTVSPEDLIRFEKHLSKAGSVLGKERRLTAYTNLLQSIRERPFSEYLPAVKKILSGVGKIAGMRVNSGDKENDLQSFQKEVMSEAQGRSVSWEEADDLQYEIEVVQNGTPGLPGLSVVDWQVPRPPIRSVVDVEQFLARADRHPILAYRDQALTELVIQVQKLGPGETQRKSLQAILDYSPGLSHFKSSDRKELFAMVDPEGPLRGQVLTRFLNSIVASESPSIYLVQELFALHTYLPRDDCYASLHVTLDAWFSLSKSSHYEVANSNWLETIRALALQKKFKIGNHFAGAAVSNHVMDRAFVYRLLIDRWTSP